MKSGKDTETERKILVTQIVRVINMTLTFSKSDLLNQIFATLIVTAEQECGVSCCDVIGSQQCFPSVKDRENSQ